MKAYSMDLRVRVIEAYNKKEGSIRELAKRFAIHWRTVANWTRRFKVENRIEPKAQKYGPYKKLSEDEGRVVQNIIEEKPDLSAQEVRDKFQDITGVNVSRSTIWRELDNRGFSFKKKSHRQLKPIQSESGIYLENMQKR